MFQSLHVCKICGKEFGTTKGVQGHQRIHSGKSKRVESPMDKIQFQRIWGFKKSRVSNFSAKEISMVTETLDLLRTGGSSFSFMTGTEQQEIKEAAMNLVFLSERVYDFGTIRNSPLVDISIDSEVNPMQEKVIHSAEMKQDFSGLLSHSGFDKSSTCSEIRFGDAVSQVLPSSPHKCKTCGKCFGSYQALGGHQTLHRSVIWKLAHKRRTLEDGNSLSVSEVNTDTQMNLVSLSKRDYDFVTIRKSPPDDISMDLKLETMQEKVIHCAEMKQDLSELLSHSGFNKPSTCREIRFGDAVAQGVPYSRYKCKTCGKCFGSHQALGGHQKLHRLITGKLAHKWRILEDSNSLSGSEVKKVVVSGPSSFEVSQKELIQL